MSAAARALAALDLAQLRIEGAIRGGRVPFAQHGAARQQARQRGLAAALRELAKGASNAPEFRYWAEQVELAR